jgi:hypothetical protein
MTRRITCSAIAAVVLLLASPWRGEAQQLRSFTTPSERARSQAKVPREYLPPAGMCRIWLDNVPPKQQPAPTDCATAVRNKPRNGRVVFSEAPRDDDKAGDRKGREGKDRPRKPEGSAGDAHR